MSKIRSRLEELEDLGWGVTEIAELLEELKVAIQNGKVSKLPKQTHSDIFIANLMKEIGLGWDFFGTEYLQEILKLMLKKKTSNVILSKEIYPQIAEKFNTSVGCIERNIRTVKYYAKRHNSSLMEEIFGVNARDNVDLKNKRFILGLYEYVRSNC